MKSDLLDYPIRLVLGAMGSTLGKGLICVLTPVAAEILYLSFFDYWRMDQIPAIAVLTYVVICPMACIRIWGIPLVLLQICCLYWFLETEKSKVDLIFLAFTNQILMTIIANWGDYSHRLGSILWCFVCIATAYVVVKAALRFLGGRP